MYAFSICLHYFRVNPAIPSGCLTREYMESLYEIYSPSRILYNLNTNVYVSIRRNNNSLKLVIYVTRSVKIKSPVETSDPPKMTVIEPLGEIRSF